MGPLTSLQDHFHGECHFHALPCPRCERPVLRDNVVEHHHNKCVPLPVGNTLTEGPGSGELRQLSSRIERLLDDKDDLQSTLSGALQNVRNDNSDLREHFTAETVALKKVYDETASRILEKQEKWFTDMKESLGAFVKQASLVPGDAPKPLPPLRCLNTLHWYIDNWSGVKSKALEDGISRTRSASNYLCGYNVVNHIRLGKNDSEVQFGSFLGFETGELDFMLKWPFDRTYRLKVIHPKNATKTLVHRMNATLHADKLEFRRPDGVYVNMGIGTHKLSMVQSLENEGFVSGNSLHLCIEIDP